VHRSADEPGDVLARLGDRLAAAADADEITELVLPVVLAELTRALHADGASLVLVDGSTIVGEESRNPGPGSAVQWPLRFGGAEVGRLTVSRRGGFEGSEREVLDRLAGQAAVAAHTVLLERRLRRSREQVVLAREEERRRLRRDLHDGVGPSLAAVALQLETARDLTTDHPAAAATLLDRLTPRVQALVGDVRALVLELRPPTLDELGLSTAVRELAARLSTAETQVEADDVDLGLLPAAVEVAAYRIAGEAATNAVRHARAARVRIELRREAEVLVVSVDDNGSGLAPDGHGSRPGGGLGIASIRQRVEEIGGNVTMASGFGGTILTAALPAGSGPLGLDSLDAAAPQRRDRLAAT
jgi:signal transduction histidine kinase